MAAINTNHITVSRRYFAWIDVTGLHLNNQNKNDFENYPEF